MIENENTILVDGEVVYVIVTQDKTGCEVCNNERAMVFCVKHTFFIGETCLAIHNNRHIKPVRWETRWKNGLPYLA